MPLTRNANSSGKIVMTKDRPADQMADSAASADSPRAELIDLTNGTFGPWLDRLNARRMQNGRLDFETALDVWIIVSRLVVEHLDRGRHLNRKEVGELLGASPATNRRRLEICDDLGLIEAYVPEELAKGDRFDKRPTYTRPTGEAVDLIDAQCREWTIRFGKLQGRLERYYRLNERP